MSTHICIPPDGSGLILCGTDDPREFAEYGCVTLPVAVARRVAHEMATSGTPIDGQTYIVRYREDGFVRRAIATREPGDENGSPGWWCDERTSDEIKGVTGWWPLPAGAES